MSYTWDRPVRFTGTPEQANANRRTHQWARPAPDETPECMECSAKTWHAAAEYPCGTEVPREIVTLPVTPDPTTHPSRPRRLKGTPP